MKTETLIPLIQIALALVFVLVLALREHSRSIEYAPPRGIMETILLLSFVEHNLQEPIADSWFEVPEGVAKSDSTRWYKHKESLKRYYVKFKEQGALSEDELLPATDREDNPFVISIGLLIVSVLLLVVTPIYSLAWLSQVREKGDKYSVVKLVHPLERAMELMEAIGFILMMVVWMVIVTYLMHGKLRLTALALLSVPLVMSVYAALKVIWWQSEWKKFWLGKLLHVLQQAGRENNHDLYNRAFNLYNGVNAHPAVPLTDVQRLILLLFALTQFLLVQAAPAAIEFFQKGIMGHLG